MGKLSSAFALTDVSACFLSARADGNMRIRPMRMLVALPGEAGGDGASHPRERPSGDGPSSQSAAWLLALLAPSAGPVAIEPYKERELAR